MRISKNDKNVDFYTSLYERENPGKLRAKRSSNVVFLVCAFIFGGFLIVYALRLTTNMTLEQQIAENVDYSTNPANIEKYEAQLELQNKIDRIKEYYDASETYLQQLSQSERFSREWVQFFDNELEQAVGSGNRINTFDYSENEVVLSCISNSPDKPKLFAEHLAGLKDEEGNPKFADIKYIGFSGSGNEYNFQITVVFWKVPDIEASSVQTEAE